MKVEVVYAASKTEQRLYSLEVAHGCTIQQAIDRSGVLNEFPEIDLHGNAENRGIVGIWSEKKPLHTPLEDGDRVEIYRPLLMSPTEARRLRAKQAKLKDGGNIE